MKINHIIAVRFFNFVAQSKNIKFILSDNTLQEGIQRVKNYLLVSLDNQTNKNFKLVFLLFDNLPQSYSITNDLKKLNSLCRYKIDVIKTCDFKQYCLYNNSLYDKTIITRIDYDDLIFNNAVFETQNIAQYYISQPLIIYGYNIGYSYHENTKYLYTCNKFYNFNGHFSAFQSVIFNSNDQNYNWINPYMFEHANVKKWLIKNNIKSFIFHNVTNYAYVWIRHLNAASINVFDTSDQIKITDNSIINNINFQYTFGKKLDIYC